MIATMAEMFLDESATQLTDEGINKLKIDIKEGEYCVFFRNNHFSVIHKRNGECYLLVTDQGYLKSDNIMWEKLDSVCFHLLLNEGLHVSGY